MRLIQEWQGVERALAQAICIRNNSRMQGQGTNLIDTSKSRVLDEWPAEPFMREPTHLEQMIDRLARTADLTIRQEELRTNPIEFANAHRDSDLHFLLARKLTKLD